MKYMCLTEYNEAETMEKAMEVLKIPADKQGMYKGLVGSV